MSSEGVESENALDRLTTKNGKLAELLYLIVGTLQKNALSAYLVMMAERLVELERVLKLTGSIYLHCDSTASHYLKMIMDSIFGAKFYQSEIVWKRTSSHGNVSRAYGNVTDTILFYTKSKNFTWNQIYRPYTASYIAKNFNKRDKSGRLYATENLRNPSVRPNLTYDYTASNGITYKPHGNGWAVGIEVMRTYDQKGLLHFPAKADGRLRLIRYLDEAPGEKVQNLWDDIPPLSSQASERLGYPTQKPVALLERILSVSSNPGDVVLDPFCGCGTAVAAEQKLGRHWKGIDVTHLSVALMTARLERDFGLKPGKDFEVEGTPKDVDAASYLFDTDPFQFQFWIVGLAGAQPYGATASNKKGKKGGDTGIDGQMFFRTPAGEKLEKVIVSVKGGKNLNPSMVRDLVGTVQRENAAIGVFLTIDEPTKGMKEEAAKAGVYRYGDKGFPKIQLLTVRDVLEGKRPQIPQGSTNMSFERQEVKTLQRQSKQSNTPSLFGDD